MGRNQLKYTHGQLKSRLTVIMVLGILSVCCMNVFSLITVPCAFIGLRLLKNGDWESDHRDEIRLLSKRIKDMKENPPQYYSMSREEYFKKVSFHDETDEEKWEAYGNYIGKCNKDYERDVKNHEKETEKLEKQLESLRVAKMPESVLRNYLRAQRLATIALVFLIIPIIIVVAIELFGLGDSLMKPFLDLV